VLVQNGKLVISLYHGTSSPFAESIAKYGLGERNPLEDLQVFPFLRALSGLAEELLGSNEWWCANK